MHLNLAILCFFVINCNGLSIERVTENYKIVTTTGDALDDKHDSDKLGKHVAIAIKKKVKKRLASPLHYKVSAFEESDDYYEKGGGESDNNSEGNYESKDWSDLNREPLEIKSKTAALRNLDLSDIDGIDVIKKQSEYFQSPKNVVKNEVSTFDSEEEDEKQDVNPIIAIHTTEKSKSTSKKPKNIDDLNDYYDIHKPDEKIIHNTEKSIQDKLKKPKDNQDINYYDDNSKQDETPDSTIRKGVTTTEKIQAKRRKTKKNYGMNDYYDSADKIKSEAEQAKEDRENEIKKIKILDAIDDLKERHAQESKLISEKFKEEELHREEFERNNAPSYPRNIDKYRESTQNKPRGKVLNDYDEYEERTNFYDKYKPDTVSKADTTVKSTTTAASSIKPPNELRKLSVFRSPQLYLSYDDIDETTEQTTRKIARLITMADSSNERISLIPEDAKEGEPTLFMPKKFYKKPKKIINDREEYQPQTKYSPNKNVKASTLSMITDNYFPTTDVSFTMATEPLYSTEVTTEPEEERRPKPTEYKFTITENSLPHRTAITDYYTEKTTEDSEVDMSGVGSDFRSITTNENFDESATDTNDKATVKYPDIEPEISLARAEESTDFVSDTTEDMTRPSIILQVHDDLASESSDHQNEDYHNKEGGGRRYESENDQENKEDGKKHYESEKEEEIIGKGYHNVKKDIDKYDSHEQVKEVYGDDSGHSASHDHMESGKKHAEYEETGKHSKGHSTKGSHDVHKKEEYEKNEEFFDYSGEEEEKTKKDRSVNSYDQRGASRQAAGKSKPRRAYAISSDVIKAQLKKPSIRENASKKWIHHHGYPARTNNLILIDRRRDLSNHWPGHFG